MHDLPIIKKADLVLDSKSKIGEGQFVRIPRLLLIVHPISDDFLEPCASMTSGAGNTFEVPPAGEFLSSFALLVLVANHLSRNHL